MPFVPLVSIQMNQRGLLLLENFLNKPCYLLALHLFTFWGKVDIARFDIPFGVWFGERVEVIDGYIGVFF